MGTAPRWGSEVPGLVADLRERVAEEVSGLEGGDRSRDGEEVPGGDGRRRPLGRRHYKKNTLP